MGRYRVVLIVEAENEVEAGAFVATLGAGPGAQWDNPLEAETVEVGEIETGGES